MPHDPVARRRRKVAPAATISTDRATFRVPRGDGRTQGADRPARATRHAARHQEEPDAPRHPPFSPDDHHGPGRDELLRQVSAAPGSDDAGVFAQGDAGRDFAPFFEDHHRDLGTLAYLLTSDRAAADDLTGDTMLAAWQQWSRFQLVAHQVAYVRRMMANIAVNRVRRLVRERGRLARLRPPEHAPGPDPVAVVSVQAALAALPARRRACVVLRLAFDLSERDVAAILGVTVGTVKSQTSKAVSQLSSILGPPLVTTSHDSQEGCWS